MARSAVYLLLLAIISPWLYDRYQAMLPMLANRPSKFKEIYNIKGHKLKFRDQVRNCEDALIEEDKGIAILSCDPGRDEWNTVMGHFHSSPDLANGGLWIYDYATPNISDKKALQPLILKDFPNANDFHPLGIEWDPETSTLYVVNHAHDASVIEIFTVSLSTYTAIHVKTFQHPLVPNPNSIHSLGAGKFYVTNDHYFSARKSILLSQIETWVGLALASVVYIDLNHLTASKLVTRLPFANGITMLNTTTLAVASTSKSGVYFYKVNSDYSVSPKGYIRTPAVADNLSLEKGSGKLLIAGHAFGPATIEVAKRRPQCATMTTAEEREAACPCDAPSWAAEWSEEEGLKELYKGHAICSSTTVVRDSKRGVGIMTGLYDRGLMIFEG